MAEPPVLSLGPARIFTGSCHCQATRYTIRLPLPEHAIDAANPPADIYPGPGEPLQKFMAMRTDIPRMYKCNCTICQKTGYFHLRVPDSRRDFILQAPASLDELGNYKGPSGRGRGDWYFCKTCGVRCFLLMGQTGLEKVTVNMEAWKAGLALEESVGESETAATAAGATQEVLRPAEGFGVPAGKDVLSINAVTLDAHQEGLDLREWHEKGWVGYCNMLKPPFEFAFGPPREGGMY